MDDDSPYAVPRSEVDDVSPTGQLASRGNRFAAVLLDWLFVSPFYLPVWYLLSKHINQSAPRDFSQFGRYTVLGSIWMVCCFLGLNIHFMRRSGQTLGKRLVGIGVVATAGSPATLGQQLRRYGFQYGVRLLPYAGGLIGLVDTLFIFRESHRCLHDDIAGTKVVNL